MEDFFKSKHCVSKKHCQACRSVKSKNFRTSVSKFYNIDNVDFECPYGINWGYQKSAVEVSAEKAEADKKAELENVKRNKKREVLAKIEANQAMKKVSYNEMNAKINKGELFMLNHKYIMNNLGVFRGIDGFDAQFEECDRLIKEATKSKKCTSCARNSINKKLVNFVIKNVKYISEDLDDNVVIPGKKATLSKDLKRKN
jgi:hypothetical protein